MPSAVVGCRFVMSVILPFMVGFALLYALHHYHHHTDHLRHPEFAINHWSIHLFFQQLVPALPPGHFWFFRLPCQVTVTSSIPNTGAHLFV